MRYRFFWEQDTQDISKKKVWTGGKIELLQILAKQESDISSFLNRLQFLERSMQQGFDPKPGFRIVCSTIHSSKGLEYDNVYMVDVYDGRFPSSRPNIFSRSKDNADGEQEERCFFYVGITRAKNRLQLFDIQGRTSTFIDDLFPERRKAGLPEEGQLCALQIEEREDIRHKQLAGQTNHPPKAVLAEQARSISMLREAYRNLPVKNLCKVEQILSEDYDQENYLIYDQMLGFRWMKCSKCGGIKKSGKSLSTTLATKVSVSSAFRTKDKVCNTRIECKCDANTLPAN